MSIVNYMCIASGVWEACSICVLVDLVYVCTIPSSLQLSRQPALVGLRVRLQSRGLPAYHERSSGVDWNPTPLQYWNRCAARRVTMMAAFAAHR